LVPVVDEKENTPYLDKKRGCSIKQKNTAYLEKVEANEE